MITHSTSGLEGPRGAPENQETTAPPITSSTATARCGRTDESWNGKNLIMTNKNHLKNRNQVNHSHPAADNHPLMRRKHSSDKTRCSVTFWLPKNAAPDAKCVAVAGSFNDWCADRHPMKRLKNGDFALEIELAVGKEHQF